MKLQKYIVRAEAARVPLEQLMIVQRALGRQGLQYLVCATATGDDGLTNGKVIRLK